MLKKYLHFYLEKFTRINKKDIAYFFNQLTIFISASIPLAESLAFLSLLQAKLPLKNMINALLLDIQGGIPLSQAMAKHPLFFNPITQHLIHLGEQTGRLEKMLITISQQHENNLAFHKRIKQALFYPLIIILFASFITFILLYFLVPHFAELFQDSKNNLPTLTAFIFWLSAMLHHYLWLMLLFIASMILLITLQYEKALNLKYWCQTKCLRFAIIQPYINKIALTQFSRHLALTYTAGVSLLPALRLAANTTHHRQLIDLSFHLIHKTRNGVQLSEAMSINDFFPPLFIQFVKIGEESGKLDIMLDKYADIAEAELDTLIQRLNVLLEPLIMLCLGVVIGGLVVGMYLPLFKLGSVL